MNQMGKGRWVAFGVVCALSLAAARASAVEVVGDSVSGDGVSGYSQSGIGVYGNSLDGVGSWSHSHNDIGAYAVSETQSALSAVTYSTTTSDAGVYSYAQYNARGVTAISQQGYGILAQSTDNYAIYGKSTTTDSIVGVAGSASGCAGIWGKASNANNFGLYSSGNAKVVGNLSVTGTASKPGGGSWTASSDLRVKKDVVPFESGLREIERVRPVRFEYNGLGGTEADGKQYVGVIAQELEQTLPFMVSSEAKPLHPGDTATTDIKRVDPSALTYVLVNSVKELAAQNREMRAQLVEQERTMSGQLAALQNELRALKRANARR